MADDPTPTPEAELKALAVDLKKATDEVKVFAEKSQTEMKNLGKVTEETKASADKALTEMNALGARVTEIEQKMARKGSSPSQPETKTIGEMVLESESFKALLNSSSKRGQANASIDLKAVVNLTTGTGTVGSTASVATSLIAPDRQGMIMLPQRRFVVRDLITPGETNSNNIEYARQTAVQLMAAPVAETAAKPQSDMTFDLRSAPVRTIAHYMKASRQILDDAPQLRSVIDGNLRYGLSYVEENQLLLGDGTGQNILGIVPQATAYSGAFAVTGETAIDRLRLATLQATLALFPATGIVLHTTDWAKIEMIKDGMGRYLVGDPQGVIAPRLWGLPVVNTQSMTVNNFLVGAFRLGAQIFDRMAIEVLLSTEDQDNFVKNMVTIRAEERLALAVYQPLAFTTGTLP
jgi:HK97 family phage major capsid protein